MTPFIDPAKRIDEIDWDNLRELSNPKLHELIRLLHQFKHKKSRERRLSRIEKRLGSIKKELIKRSKEKFKEKINET